MQPFGEESCEAELRFLGDEEYSNYYFKETPFNLLALEDDRYLLLGRRGAGKTSLTKFLGSRNIGGHVPTLHINSPDLYADHIANIAKNILENTPSIAAGRIAKVWDYILWSFIFELYKGENNEIRDVCLLRTPFNGPSKTIKEIIKSISKKYIGTDEGIAESISEQLTRDKYLKAKEKCLEIMELFPIFLAIDSLEKYSTEDEGLLYSTAGLIECSSELNSCYSSRGLHIKTFISAEIYPVLKERYVSSIAKYIRKPIYIHWKPKDLLRLISWRFCRYLSKENYIDNNHCDSIRWDNFKEVKERMWNPYFGKQIENSEGLKENTLGYIFRHTQTRPRQMVIVCNKIAYKSRSNFPNFNDVIVEAIDEAEIELSEQVMNSYSAIYLNCPQILDAFNDEPMIFPSNHLDRIAKKTADRWPNGNYTPFDFKKIATELGVVGLVRNDSVESRYIEADFEYNLPNRLTLPTKKDKWCAVHPMFYKKLRIDTSMKKIIYPFPNKPEYYEMMGED